MCTHALCMAERGATQCSSARRLYRHRRLAPAAPSGRLTGTPAPACGRPPGHGRDLRRHPAPPGAMCLPSKQKYGLEGNDAQCILHEALGRGAGADQHRPSNYKFLQDARGYSKTCPTCALRLETFGGLASFLGPRFRTATKDLEDQTQT